MGEGSKPISPTVIEVDANNPHKNIEKLDIEIPIMTPRVQREYKNLANLDVTTFGNQKVKVKTFSEEEKREIVFKHVVDEKTHHTTILKGEIEPDYRSVVGFFAQAVMRDLRLFGCYDILFGKVKEFLQDHFFETHVDLLDLNVLRNLSEVEYIRLIKDTFKKAINELTVQDKGDTEIKNYIKISESRPFVVNDGSYLVPKKSVFNKIVGDSNFELTFSEFVENCEDVISFSKNYKNKEASALRIEYKNSEGIIATYYPDFFVKTNDRAVYIVETKGREDDDDKLKFDRLKLWCEDVNFRQTKIEYKALYVKQEEWDNFLKITELNTNTEHKYYLIITNHHEHGGMSSDYALVYTPDTDEILYETNDLFREGWYSGIFEEDNGVIEVRFYYIHLKFGMRNKLEFYQFYNIAPELGDIVSANTYHKKVFQELQDNLKNECITEITAELYEDNVKKTFEEVRDEFGEDFVCKLPNEGSRPSYKPNLMEGETIITPRIYFLYKKALEDILNGKEVDLTLLEI